MAARQRRTNELLEQISMQLEQQAAANDEREG
jgi:hypothetical protein